MRTGFFIAEVRPGHWVVKCRDCHASGAGRHASRADPPTKEKAYAWRREHLASAEHQERASEDARRARRKRDDDLAAFLAKVGL